MASPGRVLSLHVPDGPEGDANLSILLQRLRHLAQELARLTHRCVGGQGEISRGEVLLDPAGKLGPLVQATVATISEDHDAVVALA